MVRFSDEFASIFDELAKMRSYVQLLEQELATEQQETKRLRQLVQQVKEHAQMMAEECERGEPIVPMDGAPLALIDPSLGRDLSLKLAAIESRAVTSNPGSTNNGVTPDWLVAAMPTQTLHEPPLPHDTLKLENSYILSKE